MQYFMLYQIATTYNVNQKSKKNFKIIPRNIQHKKQ